MFVNYTAQASATPSSSDAVVAAQAASSAAQQVQPSNRRQASGPWPRRALWSSVLYPRQLLRSGRSGVLRVWAKLPGRSPRGRRP